MTLIRSSTHRALDMLTVIGFVIAPMLLPLSQAARWLAWALAIVHLVMTLTTAFPERGHRPVPLRLHGLVELVVGVVLMVLPFVLAWGGADRWFFVIAGLIILIVRMTSQYPIRPQGAGDGDQSARSITTR